jgi:hypothetical protein
MKKRKSKGKSKLVEQTTNPKPKTQKETLLTNDEKPFDFGGLPDRDLKKNLGCG